MFLSKNYRKQLQINHKEFQNFEQIANLTVSNENSTGVYPISVGYGSKKENYRNW